MPAEAMAWREASSSSPGANFSRASSEKCLRRGCLAAGPLERVDGAATFAGRWLVRIATKEIGPAGCGWFRSHVGQGHGTRLHEIVRPGKCRRWARLRRLALR